jgi:hypothetical protein
MSLADDANLLLIPTGYKAQKLYSIFPTSGVGDFDFARTTSATRVAKNGFITTVGTNVPRLNYDILDGEVVGCPHLLLEPSRTNIFQRSEEFSNAYWNISRIETPYIANVVSPDGTLNAYTLEISNGETNGGGVYRSGISISGDNSWSIFAKKKTANYLVLADTGTTTNAVYFDLENGTVGTTYNATGEMQDFGNGWYRCTMKYTLTSSGIKFIYLSNLDGATNGGVQGGDSIYIYGAMLEQGSYPTSYIKTTNQAVTRAAETCNGAGNAATFNDSEGVLFVDSATLVEGEDVRIIGLSDGSTNNRISITYHSTENRIQIYGDKNGTIFNLEYLNAIKTDYNKVAVKYNASSVDFYYNGFLVDTVVPSDMFDSNILNSLNFDRVDNGNNFYGKTKEIGYYDAVLTDSELEYLTSYRSLNELVTELNLNTL